MHGLGAWRAMQVEGERKGGRVPRSWPALLSAHARHQAALQRAACAQGVMRRPKFALWRASSCQRGLLPPTPPNVALDPTSLPSP